MLRELRPSIVMLLLMTLITGLAYPMAITSVAQILFPWQANGSIVDRAGQPVGSVLIGQSFAGPGYFHARLSATTAPDPKDATKTLPAPYNASNSSGSNLAPTAKALVDRVADDVKGLQAEVPNTAIPADLVTTSGSGLDPHITPQAAAFQIARVATARKVPEATVRNLIAAHTEGRLLGLIGEPRVNVLALNMALDTIAK